MGGEPLTDWRDRMGSEWRYVWRVFAVGDGVIDAVGVGEGDAWIVVAGWISSASAELSSEVTVCHVLFFRTIGCPVVHSEYSAESSMLFVAKSETVSPVLLSMAVCQAIVVVALGSSVPVDVRRFCCSSLICMCERSIVVDPVF